MSRAIKIKESDITHLIKRIIKEDYRDKDEQCGGPGECSCKDLETLKMKMARGKANISEIWYDLNDRGCCFCGNTGAFQPCPCDEDDHFEGMLEENFETNISEGYKKFGCKFLQSRKSLNEDKLTHLLNTNRDVREQKTLSRKLKFIESAIGLSKCGTILREQKETTSISRNDYRRVRKLVYENMNWEAVRQNNNKRIQQNIKRNGRTL